MSSANENAEREAEQAAKDEWFLQTYGATEEELTEYNEWLNEIEEENLPTEEDIQEVYSIFAEYGNEGTDASLLRAADSREGQETATDGVYAVGTTEQSDVVGETGSTPNGRTAERDAQDDEDVCEESDVEEEEKNVNPEIDYEDRSEKQAEPFGGLLRGTTITDTIEEVQGILRRAGREEHTQEVKQALETIYHGETDAQMQMDLKVGNYAPSTMVAEPNSEYTSEEQEIIAKAKADGTYMKAPNGKPTNLTEKQWVRVRTKAFKKWFGDWEKMARAERIKSLKAETLEPMPKDKTSKEVYGGLRNGVNKFDGSEVRFFNTAYKKVVKLGGISERIIATLPKIFDNAILAYTEQDNRGGIKRKDGTIHKEHPNTTEVRNYVGKVAVDNKEYYVRFTVNVQKNDKGVHSYFATDVELYEDDKKNTTIGLSYSDLLRARGTNSGVLDAKLAQFFEDANNSSKIVDENGEPRVVNKRMAEKRNVFNTEFRRFLACL